MKSFQLCILTLLLSTNLFSQELFVEHKIISPLDQPNFVLSLDIDGDNDMDYVECSTGLYLVLNDGSMNFSRREIIDENIRFVSVDTSDINRDGRIDLIALTDYELIYYRNEGNLEFSKNIIHTQDNGKIVKAIDFDSDGDIDVLSSYEGSENIYFHKNDGNHNFSSTHLNDDVKGEVFLVVDIDQDNDFDLISSAGTTGSKINLYKNSGRQRFTHSFIDESHYSVNLRASDIDNDGDLDIVSSEKLYKTIWYRNIGQGVFESNIIASHGATKIQIADINYDGWNDIILSEYHTNSIRILKNDSIQSFVESIISDSLVRPELSSVVDLDNDSDLDMLIFSTSQNMVSMLINKGELNFTYKETIEKVHGIYSAKTADLNNDGYFDIVFSGSDNKKLVWYKNDGNNNFLFHLIDDSISLRSNIEIIDFNGDNFLDIISYSNGDSSIYYYKNDGYQNFTMETLFNNLSAYTSFELADIDGDTDLDIIMAIHQHGEKLKWYENDGNQNFNSHILDQERRFNSFEVIDINNDGFKDILVYDRSAKREFGWYENDGSQIFTYNMILESPDREVYSVSSGDYNNDGYIDFIASFAFHNGGGHVSKSINNGDGTFTNSGLPWGHSDNETSLYTSDLNTDGIQDVISNYYGNEITWINMARQNNGWRFLTEISQGLFYISSLDVDSDGDNDLILGNSTKNQIAWYENKLKPIIEFELDTLTGNSFKFNNYSYGHISSWLWSFGDDSTSTEKNPIHTYTYNDTFTVSLTALGPNGSTTLTKENYIKVSGLTSLTEEEIIPQKYLLYNNYPNPFNPSTKIKFDVKERTHVVLKVYDIQGREVETLVNKELTPASYEKSFNASQLSSGVYFYRISMGNYNAVKKMVLLK